MESDAKTRLLDEFPAHTEGQWKEAAVQLLKGRPFEKTLVTPTYEGFDLQPIYTREAAESLPHLSGIPGQGNQVRGSRPEGYLEAGWKVSQELAAPTAKELNAIARDVLGKGQNELNFWLDNPTRRGEDPDASDNQSVGVCGTSVASLADMKDLLEGIDLSRVSLYLQSGSAAPGIYALLVAALKDRPGELKEAEGCLGLDPLGWLVETGELHGDPEGIHDGIAAVVKHAAETMPRMQVLDVKGHAYHNGGASSTQEMAAVLASAVAYLRELVERGVPTEVAVSKLRISLSVGGNYFIEIAKLRAFRLLWSRVMDAFEVAEGDRGVHLHARTGLWNKTLFDPYVNMLRTTTEAFSAVVGGCDSLHVGNFDEIIREGDEFSRRIARNTHAILAEECDMRRVVDPSGGSWAVESLTDQMASEAWKKFQEIEAEGGILTSLRAGTLQKAVETVRKEKVKNIQRRKDVIVGTNSYPNASEELLKPSPLDYRSVAKGRREALEAWKSSRDTAAVDSALAEVGGAAPSAKISALVTAAAAGATLGELQGSMGSGDPAIEVTPITLHRAAGDFESLKMAARALEASGKAPLVHQLNMGPSRRYRIRADWTSAFFQVGGLQVLNTDDYEGVDEALAALAKSGSKVAIITSDDETYSATVEELAKAIKALDAAITVLVAGAPGEHEAAWREAGVDDFVNVRVNNYQFNRSLLESMGAAV